MVFVPKTTALGFYSDRRQPSRGAISELFVESSESSMNTARHSVDMSVTQI